MCLTDLNILTSYFFSVEQVYQGNHLECWVKISMDQ